MSKKSSNSEEKRVPSWLGLKELLEKKIFEQDEAVQTILSAHQRIEADLTKSDRPMASLMFLGPTGSGKTELAKLWASYLGMAFYRLDMSAFSEPHTVSSLVGAPSGYVGSDRPSQLYELASKQKKFVLLLDELEKAHPDVIRLFLSVLDAGVVKDRSGKTVDFRGAVIIMTTNAATKLTQQIGFSEQSDHVRSCQVERSALIEDLQKWFPPEFLGRIDAITRFNRLSKDGLGLVLDKKLVEISLMKGLKKRRVRAELTTNAANYIVERATAENLGARPIGHILDRELTSTLAKQMVDGGNLADCSNSLITVDSIDGNSFFISKIEELDEAMPEPEASDDEGGGDDQQSEAENEQPESGQRFFEIGADYMYNGTLSGAQHSVLNDFSNLCISRIDEGLGPRKLTKYDKFVYGAIEGLRNNRTCIPRRVKQDQYIDAKLCGGHLVARFLDDASRATFVVEGKSGTGRKDYFLLQVIEAIEPLRWPFRGARSDELSVTLIKITPRCFAYLRDYLQPDMDPISWAQRMGGITGVGLWRGPLRLDLLSDYERWMVGLMRQLCLDGLSAK